MSLPKLIRRQWLDRFQCKIQGHDFVSVLEIYGRECIPERITDEEAEHILQCQRCGETEDMGEWAVKKWKRSLQK